jgi:hypothetical protein
MAKMSRRRARRPRARKINNKRVTSAGSAAHRHPAARGKISTRTRIADRKRTARLEP